MKRTGLSIALSILSFGMMFGQQITQTEVNAQLQNLPFASFSITLQTFKDNVYNITDAGAKGDGITKCTDAINSTIKKCSAEGGGKVLIPAGLWLTGPITMQSNVNLHLDEGAIVIFSSDLNDYPLIQNGDKYSLPDLINGSGLENVAITGQGIFNGNGQDWRMVKKEKRTEKEWKDLTKTGEVSADGKVWYPRVGSIAAEELLKSKKIADLTNEDWDKIKLSLRPYMLAIEKCKNVLIEGVTLNNSPKFAAYLKGHNGMVLHDVKVMNEWWMQNADGLDISVCKNVLFYECTVNTGDDGICMKSGNAKKDEFNMENIVIKDCKVFHAHGGFVIGSNTDGNMRNIYVKNCTYTWTDSGIRVKSGAGRGGKVTNIFCEDIYMKDINGEGIVYELEYEDKGAVNTKDTKVENAKIPNFDGFSMKNIFIDGAKIGVSIGGNDDSHVKNVSFQNMVIKAKEGFKSSLSENITVDNVKIIPSTGPAYTLNKVNGFTFKNIKDIPATGTYVKVLDAASKKIIVENSSIKANQVEMLNGVSPSELIIK